MSSKKRKPSGDPRRRSGGRVTFSQPKRPRKYARVVPDARRTFQSLTALLWELEARFPDA